MNIVFKKTNYALCEHVSHAIKVIYLQKSVIIRPRFQAGKARAVSISSRSEEKKVKLTAVQKSMTAWDLRVATITYFARKLFYESDSYSKYGE